MNDHQQWLQDNNAYLRDALKWLHLRLERLIAERGSVPADDNGKTNWFKRSYSPPSEKNDKAENDKAIAAIAKKLTAAEAAEPPPALLILSRQLGLTRFEQDILLLCTAMELDGKTAALCAKAQDNPYKPYPTFSLALTLFEQPAWDALSSNRPLRYWRLVEINQPGAEPLTTSALRADERIVNYLVEPKQRLDDRLLPFVVPLAIADTDTTTLSPSQLETAQALRHYLDLHSNNAGQYCLIQLTGADPQAKWVITAHALSPLGLQIIRFPLEALPTQTGELENFLRLWGRECLLLPLAFYLDAHQADDASIAATTVLQRLLSGFGGIVVLGTRDLRPEFDSLTLEINKPTASEQQTAWHDALAPSSGELAARLAGQFNLNLAVIRQIANAALAEQPEPADLQPSIWQACLIKTSPRLDQLAQRLDAKARWEHLVLPKEPMALLRQITDQVGQRSKVYNDWGFLAKMNRGLGLSVLFAGESGTGKTMAAEVIANALGLHLYRIDLAAVVSKYIGETEKNLRRLFDAAEDGGALLFFDEADALFGKRSEVKDSHDRYANIEINYLLQRIESYRGLAILATNMKSALDQAFMRRLRFIVNFPFPGATERGDLWRKVFPPETPVGELDYQHLARFNLTGGSIHNIALNAAFLAARADSPKVTMALIFEAMRNEFRKLDKPVNEAEFRIVEIAGAKS
ncbi:MAG: ATP-binding protein [Methylobacter sp.]|nr:ATP-binding protein [Candidatus Methylobacter titanis]